MTTPLLAVPRRRSRNPYVGPRAFQPGDRLYGRDKELAEVVDRLIAERVVLMYSPSGAGKTSLIQASLIPELQRQCFLPLPIARVNIAMSRKDEIDSGANRYALSVMLSLESKLRPPGQQRTSDQLSEKTMREYIRTEAARAAPPANEDGNRVPLSPRPPVLIIDQFEEILLLDPSDVAGQHEFFRQLGDVLDDEVPVWALLSMREDYVAGLDKFSHELPTSLNVRYRLDLLERSSAKEAIKNPPYQLYKVSVSDDAVTKLIDNLSTIIVQRPGSPPQPEVSPYVEGVILQTVCSRLWDQMDPLGNDLRTIEPAHLGDLSHVDWALAGLYTDAVDVAARRARVRERVVRDWFEQVLITEQGFRSITDRGPGDDPRKAYRCLHSLERQHVIRTEPRLNRPWYELIHDRLIQPVRQANAAWREENGFGDTCCLQARQWRKERSPQLLMDDGATLARAIEWLSEHEHDAYDYEREFIDESLRVLSERPELADRNEADFVPALKRSRHKWRVTALGAITSLVVVTLLLVWSLT